MAKRFAFHLARIAALLFVALLLALRPAPATRAAASKIMALGDSITGSPGCWRAILWNKLRSAGYSDFQPVGTLWPQGCPQGDDGMNEGHGGYLATGIANQDQLPPWLSATNPDIVLMHLGTNDIFSGTNTTAMILAAYGKLVGQMRSNNPNMKIVVAQIIPVYTSTSGCTECYQRVISLNAAIPSWASGLSTAQSPIVVVDQWTGFNTTTDTGDGIHPNNIGFQKMADRWYPALASLLSGGTPATATRTPTSGATQPPPTATRTATTGANPTATRTRTATTGTNPTATRTRTATTGANPTATRTATTSSGGTCSPATAITAPFTFDGAGTRCWQIGTIPSYINSWNLTSLTINGVSFANVYATPSQLPARINGFWYIAYNSSVAWGHFEAK